jgi:glycosyltransferase involved in cell wall biosynthesis
MTANVAVKTISVVIPVFNRPLLLRRAVASVVEQTYPIHEVIIVDDASEAAVTAATLGVSDPRIKIVRLDKRLGPSAARQAGIDRASGELIAFLDSDDVWLRDKIDAQVRCLEAAAAPTLTAVSCGWQVADVQRRISHCRMPVASDDVADFASGCWFSPGSTALLPRRAFDVVGPLDTELRRLEDLEWFLRFALAGGRLIVAPIFAAIVFRDRRVPNSTNVRAAIERIVDRHVTDRAAALSAANRRRLRAWLDIEMAAAAHWEGDIPLMLWSLVRSFALAPRSKVELRSWWTSSPPIRQVRFDRDASESGETN